MESSEWPNAIMMAAIGMVGHTVPLNHPNPSVLNSMFRANGAGGDCAAPCNRMVKGHQIRNNATITVVICMMRRALPLDSWMPLTLFHQKYAVTIVAKTVANWFGGIW